MGRKQKRIVRLARFAMATQFEIALWGLREDRLRTAAEMAMEEVRRLEEQLSFFRHNSDISDLNAHAADAPMPVDPRLFRLIQRAKELSELTGGAFDITVAPLLRAWGFSGGAGRMADEEQVSAARELTGMHLIELGTDAYTVRFLKAGVMIDLGAIGKGYAIEQAAEILRDLEVGGALLHGGTSTVQAVGTQPDGEPWPVAIRDPAGGEEPLAVAYLRDEAMSVSAPHGKSFTHDGVEYGHVLDPRTGRPGVGAALAAVRCPSATDSDALSTGLLIAGETVLPAIAARPTTSALLKPAGEARIVSAGWDS